MIPDGFFKYIYHVGCAINLHSIINSGLIPGGQNLSNRQTVFFTAVNPMNKDHRDPHELDKNHKDLDTIDLGAPRLAQYMHKAWKKHKNTVYWVDINFALSNAIILHETLPAYCIPNVVRMETGKVKYEKVHASPRPPPKISLETEVARQAEGEVAR